MTAEHRHDLRCRQRLVGRDSREPGLQLLSLHRDAGGQPVEVIYAPADFAGGEGRPSRVAFRCCFRFQDVFPARLFAWEGKQYALEPGDAFGNAIHGFALSRPWRVIEQSDESHRRPVSCLAGRSFAEGSLAGRFSAHGHL